MICVASFIVFGILGIFSASYRELAFEAYNCMLDRLTQGECDADFEDKVKAGAVGRALDRSPRAARFLDKHFEKLSIIFVLVFVLVSLYVLKSIVFLGIYGSCTGPQSSGCTITEGLNIL